MSKFDEYLRSKAEEEQCEIPDSAKEKIDQILCDLPEVTTPKHRIHILRRLAVAAACLAFVTVFLLPNISVAYAEAVEKIPVIGKIVKVVTIRNYFYSDNNHEMDVKVPKIEEDNSKAADSINKDINELTNTVISQFYKDLKIDGNTGRGSVYLDYETITDTNRWFTLKLTVTEISGSGNQYYKYYHIDKNTGKIVSLGDLFNDSSFESIITNEIKRRMEIEMKNDSDVVYWLDDSIIGKDIVSVNKNHNFYFNKKGELVIPFDEYEVAPGSMGCPEFVIDNSIIKGILKPRFSEIIK